MVMEISPAETLHMSSQDSSRKRTLSGCDVAASPQMSSAGTQTAGTQTAGTQTMEAKRTKPSVANNGWGELFKDRQTFIDMHLH